MSLCRRCSQFTRRVEHRSQKEGDDKPADEGAHLPEQEERAQHHRCGE